MRRVCTLLLILVSGCDLELGSLVGAKSGDGESGKADTLIVGKPGDAIGLDPARVADDESVEVCEQIYDHLVRYAPTSTEVQPALATAWEVTENGTLWTFHLRDGVRFHDGTPFDAEAVKFSFDRQRDPFHPNHEDDFEYWKSQYSYIEKIEVLDRLTVRIKIERPYAPFLSSLAMYPASIVSPAAVKKWGHEYPKHPVGTGPFRFESWTPGDRIVLRRWEDGWGERGRLTRIVFRDIPDARQRLIALEGGAVDVAFSILPEELQYVKLHPDLRLHHVAVANVSYLAMNVSHKPFNDVEVRHAVAHAVNKVPIVKLVYQGLGVPASGPVPPSLWSYRADVPDYPYDPARAREILAKAAAEKRWDPDQRLTLYVGRTPRSYLPDPEQVARVIQRNLADVGIQTDLVVQEFSAHQADIYAGKHDLAVYGWTSDNGDPDNFLKVLLDRDETHIGPEQNISFYRSAELHGLLTYAEETMDQEERTRYYHRAQEIIARDAPWVPIAHSEMAVAARTEVEDLSLHPTATVYYSKVWLSR